MYKLIKPILFLLPPEKAHNAVVALLKLMYALPGVPALLKSCYLIEDDRLKQNLFGLEFKNPVGIAAGFDKDAKVFNELSCFGFGFVEIGTVTPEPQSGNPRPRLFRLKRDEALINRMGFNNDGVEAAVKRLKNQKENIIIGGNIGKNKVTPNEEAGSDYEKCFHALFPFVDYFVVNVSSPNTPGLRSLQEKEPLKKLLIKLQQLNDEKEKRKPILLKIAPDLTNEQLDDIIEIIKESKLDGVIATNTTISREDLTTPEEKIKQAGNGGLSGKPLKDRSTEVIKYISEKSGKAFPIIGVGGIHSVRDAMEKIEAGADLLQLYTGFIYEGPALVKNINKAILDKKPEL